MIDMECQPDPSDDLDTGFGEADDVGLSGNVDVKRIVSEFAEAEARTKEARNAGGWHPSPEDIYGESDDDDEDAGSGSIFGT